MVQTGKGLTQAQAAARLAQVGENRLAQGRRSSAAALFFSQFKDVMILILAAATLASIIMGQGAEAVAIIAIVLLNAIMGFIQEYRTEKTLEALKELSAPIARVRRDGRLMQVSAFTIVPGDLLLLEAGDRIAADCRMEDGAGAACDESMLTGESASVHKSPGDLLYMGCTMATGRCEATVTATGMETEMGKIAHLVTIASEDPTPLQLRLRQLGRYIAAVCVIVCLAVAALGFLQGNDFLTMLLTGVSLAVAAIPEGLPAIVTITLALSVGRILRRGAVIRRLHAVETLGCAGVICTDKTGTVTQNRMTVRRIVLPGCTCEVSGSGYAVKGQITTGGRPANTGSGTALARLLADAVLCSHASIRRARNVYEVTGDATEAALLVAAAKGNVEKNELLRDWRVTDEHPFDSTRKLMSVTVTPRAGGQSVLLCKGAPEAILERCTLVASAEGARPMSQAERCEIRRALASMTAAALRVLAFAEGADPAGGEHNLCWLGMAGMVDPPRPEVAPAVRRCRQAGIQPVMITGDAPDTALAIAREVGIARPGDHALTGAQLDNMSDSQLAAVCMGTTVYARVTPAHKLRIVRAYKAAGQVTAMTGDGVNDAPAVKEADIGVAMGLTGTDVTKEASSVVILDDNFATIVSAVEEGRVIYQNIRRFIRYLLTSNLGEVLGMFFGMALGLPVTLLPIQILLVNLFTDGLPAVALGMEGPDADMMRRPPRPKNEGLFAHGLAATIAVRGVQLAVCSCGAYWYALSAWGDLTVARTVCFAVVVLAQLVHLFECRGGRLLGNPALLASAGASALLTMACIYLPQAQALCSTAALGAPQLLCVLLAVAAGPVFAGLCRLAAHSLKATRAKP